jgi:hypothetical protein
MGWIGDKSVPMTSADGKSSAKSLSWRQCRHNSWHLPGANITYSAHIPVPVPTSSTLYYLISNASVVDQANSSNMQIKHKATHLRVRTDWCKEEIIVKE